MKLHNVSKSFDGKSVLKNFSLEIQDGETVLISGVSGRGKTTLLRLMMGLILPDEGEVDDIPRSIAAVFQEDRLPNDFTPYVCVKMTAPHVVSGATVLNHLSEVGLADCTDKPVSQLSGGMRRRVAIARAIVCDALTVFLDEPFTGLDRETKLKTIDYIKKYTQGKTLIVVSHDDEDASLLNARKIRI